MLSEMACDFILLNISVNISFDFSTALTSVSDDFMIVDIHFKIIWAYVRTDHKSNVVFSLSSDLPAFMFSCECGANFVEVSPKIRKVSFIKMPAIVVLASMAI